MVNITNKRPVSKRYAGVNTENCVACGACSQVCPMGAAQVWRGCYCLIDAARCIGCGKCAGRCPAGCIELKERDSK